MPPLPNVTCEHCGAIVVAKKQADEWISGYGRYRTSGGFNGVRGVEHHNRWACRTCADKVGAGQNPAQEGLW